MAAYRCGDQSTTPLDGIKFERIIMELSKTKTSDLRKRTREIGIELNVMLEGYIPKEIREAHREVFMEKLVELSIIEKELEWRFKVKKEESKDVV